MRKTYRPIFLINLHTEILKKIVANQIEIYSKKSTHLDQVWIIPVMQEWLNIQKPIMWFTTSKNSYECSRDSEKE